MKRINERKEDCYKSLKKLENKFITSNFNPKLVEHQFKKIYSKNENENISNKTKNKNVYWSTQFKKLLRFTKEETKLFLLGKISFTKPVSLRKLLNNYSQIAKQKQTKTNLIKKCENAHFVEIMANFKTWCLIKKF